jgi:acetoin utilization deacetylase AcuC-like enzyme
MKLLYNKISLEHNTGMHPENRKRLEVFQGLGETALIDGSPFLKYIHTKSYVEQVKRAYLLSSHLDQDTVVSKGSFAAAIAAVGTTIMASNSGDFALVRPPGHHAYSDRSSGFCIFNNIGIATQKLVEEGKRVLLFDFDGHLGDGTSHLFYNTDQVLYWSIHQYPAFPGNGFVNEIGEGSGKGFNVNVPLPPGSGDDIFMNAVDTFLPVADQYKPDVVAISAGFDAHLYDLLLDLRVTAESFYHVGIKLQAHFDHLFATLEGGYNVEELPKCVFNFVAGINNETMPYNEQHTTSERKVWEEYELRLQEVIKNLQPFWNF